VPAQPARPWPRLLPPHAPRRKWRHLNRGPACVRANGASP
jgi:hypothetical protein